MTLGYVAKLSDMENASKKLVFRFFSHNFAAVNLAKANKTDLKIMNTLNSKELISQAYLTNYNQLVGFISKKVNDSDDAQDLAQDVFVRLLSYTKEILEENLRSLLYTVAVNLINDYLRHLYVKNDVHGQMMSTSKWWEEDTEHRVIGHDLAHLETEKLSAMPTQRRMIYIMRIHEGKTSQEVADSLGISKRTAENHYYLGITQMREYFRACV